jgi:hypothetical protein
MAVNFFHTIYKSPLPPQKERKETSSFAAFHIIRKILMEIKPKRGLNLLSRGSQLPIAISKIHVFHKGNWFLFCNSIEIVEISEKNKFGIF